MIRERISRRRFLEVSSTAISGLAATAIVGCKDAGKTTNQVPTEIPRKTQTPTQPTPTPPELTPTATSTSETPHTSEGVIDLGDWQIGILSWEEADYQPTTDGISDEIIDTGREGWKKVILKGVARNVSGGVLNIYHSIGEQIFSDRLKFSIESPDGFSYDASTEWMLDDNMRLPEGFGMPITITAPVPQNQTDYLLKVSGVGDTNLVAEAIVQKGEIAADYPLILAEVNIKNPQDPWEIPNFATVYLNKAFVLDVNVLNVIQEQYASFDLQNNYGQDIQTSYGVNANLEMLVYLKDGRVVEGSEYYYAQNTNQPDAIAPGLKKTIDIRFGDTYEELDQIAGEIYDVQGAVVVLIYRDWQVNQIGTPWAAWRLP